MTLVYWTDLQGAEDVVEEELVEVDRDELEEVLVQQGKHLVPHMLLVTNAVRGK